MLPGISYYLSRFYRKDELVFRLGVSSLPLFPNPILSSSYV